MSLVGFEVNYCYFSQTVTIPVLASVPVLILANIPRQHPSRLAAIINAITYIILYSIYINVTYRYGEQSELRAAQGGKQRRR